MDKQGYWQTLFYFITDVWLRVKWGERSVRVILVQIDYVLLHGAVTHYCPMHLMTLVKVNYTHLSKF